MNNSASNIFLIFLYLERNHQNSLGVLAATGWNGLIWGAIKRPDIVVDIPLLKTWKIFGRDAFFITQKVHVIIQSPLSQNFTCLGYPLSLIFVQDELFLHI